MQETTRNVPEKVLPCVGAQLELYSDRVKIRHPGWLTFIQTDCCFPLSAVHSVTVDTMNALLSIISFQIEVHDEMRVRDVIFQRKHEPLAREIKERIDEHINDRDVLFLIHEQFATIGAG
jgi:hypothetical protein